MDISSLRTCGGLFDNCESPCFIKLPGVQRHTEISRVPIGITFQCGRVCAYTTVQFYNNYSLDCLCTSAECVILSIHNSITSSV